MADLWPEAGVEVNQAAGRHFHSDPSGFLGRFATGELGLSQMREARVADLLEAFSRKAADDVNRRFGDASAPAFYANVRLFDDVLPSWRPLLRLGSRSVCPPTPCRTTCNASSRSRVSRGSSPSSLPATPWVSASQTPGRSAVWLQGEPGDVSGAILARARGIPVVTSLKEVVGLLVGD